MKKDASPASGRSGHFILGWQVSDADLGGDAFTEHVAEQMRREVRGAQVTVKGPLTLTVSELQANLDRIFAFCGVNATGCQREISTYVKGVPQTYSDRLAPLSKGSVRIIVRTRAYVEGAVSNKVMLQPAISPAGW